MNILIFLIFRTFETIKANPNLKNHSKNIKVHFKDSYTDGSIWNEITAIPTTPTTTPTTTTTTTTTETQTKCII